MCKVTILAVVLLGLASVAFGQSSQPAPVPESTPVPKPSVKRRGLDQFGLSSGAFSTNTPANANRDAAVGLEPVAKEYLDPSTFDIIVVSMEKSQFLEEELLRVLQREPGVDMSEGSPFSQYCLRHIVGVMHVSAVQRSGKFGGAGIRPGQITKILEEIENTIHEISAVLGSSPAAYARQRTHMNAISERYGVAIPTSPTSDIPLDKPTLLKLMMAKINGNYARLKRTMAVKK